MVAHCSQNLIQTKGYHQIELEESSRHIITFSTHKDLFRFKRLNFGISSAAEFFQKLIEQTLEGINGTSNISGDITIYGDAKQQHDTALNKVLLRLQEHSLKLNRSICEFGKTQL